MFQNLLLLSLPAFTRSFFVNGPNASPCNLLRNTAFLRIKYGIYLISFPLLFFQNENHCFAEDPCTI